jgi:hypothetical protein
MTRFFITKDKTKVAGAEFGPGELVEAGDDDFVKLEAGGSSEFFSTKMYETEKKERVIKETKEKAKREKSEPNAEPIAAVEAPEDGPKKPKKKP